MFRLALLAFITALAWLIFAWSDGNQLFSNSFIPVTLQHLAIGLTAGFVALAVAGLVLNLGLRQGLGVEPTGAQRVIVYALVTFVASAVALKFLGQNITAILTTSAIITAIVGFALQPTLGGLFSGVALQLDRHLRPGSGIVYEGEDTRIESMNWRSVIGRRRDHSLIVIPNSKLANEAVEIYAEDRAIRHDTDFYAPVSIPPQRISKLVRDLVSDLTYVEGTHAVMVSPVEQLPDIAALKYRVRYRVAYYFEIPEVEGEVYRRIWYGFQRHDIPLPVSRLYSEALRDRQTGQLGFPEGFDVRDAVRVALASSVTDDQIESLARRLETEGRVLLYGPGERISIPTPWSGRRYLLAAGNLSQDDPEFADRRCYGPYPTTGARRLFVHQLSDGARLRRIADELAHIIGPYAETAVKQAALTARDLADLCHRLAAEIDTAAERERFLAACLPAEADSWSPGLVFEARRDVTGHFLSVPHFRAVDEAVIIVLPDDLKETFELRRGDTA
ncbi:MAG: mechanosensitive ion channel domain-containing protein [Pseudomonadota bacterium]|nr:mechanosensitive ion channel domain-containing protein [Pseudomonadota bacterium]